VPVAGLLIWSPDAYAARARDHREIRHDIAEFRGS
jgi:hypothetical protein